MAMTETNEKQPSQDIETLRDQLDEALESYLNLLDRYTKARDELSKTLSSGYLSLAQANFASSGRRFGRDQYDDRMQAGRRVKVVESSGGEGQRRVSSLGVEVITYDGEANTVVSEKDGAETDAEDAGKADHQTKREPSEDQDKPVKTRSKDPIRWFGMMTPSALRSCQTTFIKVVEGSIPNLVNLSLEIKDTEISIGRLRKTIRRAEKVALPSG